MAGSMRTFSNLSAAIAYAEINGDLAELLKNKETREVLQEAKDNPEYGRLEYLVHVAKLGEFYSVIRHYPGPMELGQWKVANKVFNK